MKTPDKVSACYNETSQFLQYVAYEVSAGYDLYKGLEGDFEELYELIVGGYHLVRSIGPLEKSCNFTKLEEAFATIFGPDGMSIIRNRALWNMESLWGDLDKLKSGNPYKMGDGVGDALRRLLDVSL
jgi:hypothetical protein